ncbi:hypothetical protein M514_17951, partial [Trichuris suis]
CAVPFSTTPLFILKKISIRTESEVFWKAYFSPHHSRRWQQLKHCCCRRLSPFVIAVRLSPLHCVPT